MLRDKKLFAIFLKFCATDALPDVESFEGAAFVYEKAWRFGHETHANQHDGRSPACNASCRSANYFSDRCFCFVENGRSSYLDIDKNCRHNVAEDFTQGNVELVQGNEITTILPGYRLGDVDWHRATLEPDAQA